MLKIEDITYNVEGRPLFEGASATIPTGHKVGLVGRNGAGKTTLFRLIRGELALEGGAITLPQRARIGGVAQEVPSSETSLLDTVLAADTERAALMAESETHRPAPDRRDPGAAGRHRRLVGRGERSSILKGLGFDAEEQLMPCSAFPAAGGCAWRWRACCSPSPITCCWTNRPTISTSKARSGWKATCRNIPIPS
jgi:ATP-binding cassette subfamily F protein 3